MNSRELSIIKEKENKTWNDIEGIIKEKGLDISLSDVKVDYFKMLEKEQYIFSLS